MFSSRNVFRGLSGQTCTPAQPADTTWARTTPWTSTIHCRSFWISSSPDTAADDDYTFPLIQEDAQWTEKGETFSRGNKESFFLLIYIFYNETKSFGWILLPSPVNSFYFPGFFGRFCYQVWLTFIETAFETFVHVILVRYGCLF